MTYTEPFARKWSRFCPPSPLPVPPRTLHSWAPTVFQLAEIFQEIECNLLNSVVLCRVINRGSGGSLESTFSFCANFCFCVRSLFNTWKNPYWLEEGSPSAGEFVCFSSSNLHQKRSCPSSPSQKARTAPHKTGTAPLQPVLWPHLAPATCRHCSS